MAQGMQRIFSVLAGVLAAVGIATFVGLSWWSLGAVVAVSLVVGVFLRLGSSVLEVPISAMLVLAVGAGAEGAAVGRVYETLIGAAVGVAVNFAVAPPVHVRPAGDAIGQVAGQLCRELFDRTFYLPNDKEAEAYGPPARAALADVLEYAAEAMRGVADVAGGPIGGGWDHRSR